MYFYIMKEIHQNFNMVILTPNIQNPKPATKSLKDTPVHGQYLNQVLLLLLSCFSSVWLCATPQTAAHQALPSLGFSRQEYWSGLPFPSPMHESEKGKWSRSVMSNSSRPRGLQRTRLLCPWDFPVSTGVGCHCLLRGKDEYMYVNGWVPSLFTWNYHDIFC